MADTLTYEQRLAVENRGGNLLVSAAAGSGKTKVLVDRLISYILDPVAPANIDDFLIITYTKAAAAELRGKIAAKLSELIAQMPSQRHLQQQMQRLYLAKISTVHAFCADILRQYTYRLDVSADFRVADENESQRLQEKAMELVINSAYESASENPYFCALVDTQGLGRDDRQIPEIVKKVYSSAMCHLNPENWLISCNYIDQIDNLNIEEFSCGKYLVEDLRSYLSLQIDTIQRCVYAAQKTEGMEKPVALFESTLEQLRALADCKTWDEIVLSKHIDYGRLVFPKKCSNLHLADQMKAIRKACKDGLEKKLRAFTDDGEQIKKDIRYVSNSMKGLIGLVKAFGTEYNKLKKSYGVLDFSDLEHKTLDLFLGKKRSGITAVAQEVGECFREIMIDEYQDSNSIQDAIFTALTNKRHNCFMVGDVKQSIYQFRLADPQIFVEKYNSYVPVEVASEGECRKILLSKNFRSSKEILQCVNDVFTECMSSEVGGIDYGPDEMLREGISHIPLEEPEITFYAIDVQKDSYEEEAVFVSNEILSLLNGNHLVRSKDGLRKIQPEDIAILLRSPSSIGGTFLDALQAKGIQCTTGESVDLLQTEEISTVRSILQIINNPLQDIPLVSVLTSPVYGFDAEKLAQLRSVDRFSDIYTIISNSKDSKCIEFVTQINEFRHAAQLLTVTQLLGEIYTKTNLLSVFSSMNDGACRLDNLQSFFQIVSDYEMSGPKELGKFLEYLDSCIDRGLSISGAKQGSGAVTIMSIHKSKGLEFPVVFLCGLSRSFNQESIRGQVLCDKNLGIGLSCVDTSLRIRYPTLFKRAISTKMQHDSVSEELRVLYVAMTRAKDRLIMTYAERNLSSTLQDIAMRIDMTDQKLLAMDVSCPGEWILQAALRRTEAGELFSIGGPVDCAKIYDYVWKISVIDSVELPKTASKVEILQPLLSEKVIRCIEENLGYTYPWSDATQIPSKITATQLKGRFIDDEVAEGTEIRKAFQFRKPGKKDLFGKFHGNTIHSVLQHIRYDFCDSRDSICLELKRMMDEGLFSVEQYNSIDPEKLLQFFLSPLGEKLRSSGNVLREFKFSLLDYSEKYYPNVLNEHVLLQGVVDCAIIEEDGIIVLDFKTDYVTEETILNIAESYRSQVMVYADALERIFQLPIKSVILYFFSRNQFVNIV